VIDDGIATGDMGIVATSALVMIGLSLLSMVFTSLNTVYSVRVSESFSADVRNLAEWRIAPPL
jgi:hypothetical protein